MRLPVDAAVPELLAAFTASRAVVLEAPPGAGKTTRVPPALLALDSGEVLVLEPRRLAARLAARRVAEELGERLGETVGYQVRFEDVSSAGTRLRFLTEGVLTRRLLSDGELKNVGTVVLDEFHERHLDGDLALALLLRLQRTQRPDLRILVMSATLDAAPVAAHLGGCPVVRSEGRLFETDLRYTPASSLGVEEQVAAALDRLSREKLAGDVLVFLPGGREIRRAMELSAPLLGKLGWLGVPLFGDLSPEEQDRAVTPADRRKVIFSTNVAESSVTIEGVRVVVDAGLARIPHDSPWTGLPSLEVKRVSQASARQRAGRAARTGPGVVVRLYTEEDFVRRPAQETPEVQRRELSQVVLDLRAMGVRADELPWLDAPPAAALSAAEALLDRLGAQGELGRRMARLPLHPRLARMALEAAALGALREGADAAGRISTGVSEQTYESRRVAQQIERLIGRGVPRAADSHAVEKATLAAFPDRVAKRHRDAEVQLAGGGSAVLAGRPHRGPAWLVAVDVEHRRERGLPVIRTWVEIEPDWLLEYETEEKRELVWNREAERVEEVQSLRYDGLLIDESRGRPADRAAAARMLAEKAVAVMHRFAEPDELEALLARVRFAAAHAAVGEAVDPKACLAEMAADCVSLSELESMAAGGGLLRAIESRLGNAALLERVAPQHLTLPSGRRARVHYAEGKPPWVESRLQDFFGLRESPRVAGGQVAVVCHLLAPNQRPVQITQDLAGFWERHYPEIRRELSRRYPRHAWPEKPI